MCLWHSASSALMEDLQLIEPASPPSLADYQNLIILSSPSDSPPAETFEEDPEDNIELCNEVGILDHLETRLWAMDDSEEDDHDDQPPGDVSAPSPSTPTMSRGSSMLEATEGHPHKSAGPGCTCPNDARSDDELLREYWEENPRPTSLPPIRTLIETVDDPNSTTELQKPTCIWQEIVKLETERKLDDVCLHITTIYQLIPRHFIRNVSLAMANRSSTKDRRSGQQLLSLSVGSSGYMKRSSTHLQPCLRTWQMGHLKISFQERDPESSFIVLIVLISEQVVSRNDS